MLKALAIYRQTCFAIDLLMQLHLPGLSLLVAFSLHLSECGKDCQPGRVGDLSAHLRVARGADLFSFLPLQAAYLSTPLYSLPFVLLQLLEQVSLLVRLLHSVRLSYHYLLQLVELPPQVHLLQATPPQHLPDCYQGHFGHKPSILPHHSGS